MSTRSIIARPTDTGFEGRYHHSDGYPSGLGAYLFSLFHDTTAERYAELMHILLEKHPAGWSFVVGADLSKRPMRWRQDAGVDWSKPYGPRCYCHGGRSDGPSDYLSSQGTDDGGAEYVYELWPDRMVIRAVASSKTDDLSLPVNTRYPPLAVVRYSDPAPDWKLLDTAKSLVTA